MSTTTGLTIRPFEVHVLDEDLADLGRRIAATRWASRELVKDRSQGVQLATIQELARYWTADYDWRRCEARLNALPQFMTEIDGVDIHFGHVKSPHPDALPLIITHGWPGSVIEMLEVVAPLTDPAAHGSSAADAFDLVLPSLPGYGFSAGPAEVGWDPGRIARAWAELMRRLGYTRYVAQGGDQGAAVTHAMGAQASEGLLGIHLNFLREALGNVSLPTDSAAERAAVAALNTFRTSGSGYFLEQATRPQTIGYALLDSPVALAAWMLDHDTDSYYKISRAFTGGQPAGNLSCDHILDNITLYWGCSWLGWRHGAQRPCSRSIALEVLLGVARTGSLNSAAREIGVSQQAVSARIRAMQAQTGVALVHRTPRGSTLTAEGAVIAEWAARLLDVAAGLDAGIAALRADRRSRLRVSASSTIAEQLLPAWLGSFRAAARPGRPPPTSCSPRPTPRSSSLTSPRAARISGSPRARARPPGCLARSSATTGSSWW